MDEQCIPRIDDLNKRKKKYDAISEVEIPEDCKIYRVIKKLDKKNSAAPDFSCFTDKGLSVFVQGSNLPPLQLEDIFEKWKHKGYLGIWEMPRELFPEEEYLLRHDPFPYEAADGEECEQDPNHAQIFCSKPQSKGKAAVRAGRWAVSPKTSQM